jgi:hypothetical protein
MLSPVDVDKVWRCKNCVEFRELAKKYLNVIILTETMVRLHDEEAHESGGEMNHEEAIRIIK